MATARERGPLLHAVAEVLRVEAARRLMTGRALGSAAGIPPATVSKALTGKHVIDVTELYKLSTALKLRPSEVMRRAEALVDDEHGISGVDVEDDVYVTPPSEPPPDRGRRTRSPRSAGR